MPSTERNLILPHGAIHLPAFLPDATFGVVRGVDALDLAGCGVQALMMNTFHLLQTPGSSSIQSLGGLHAMSGWNAPIITDSGGFQVYSLIHQDARFGRLSDRGAIFRLEGAGRSYQLTPEKSVQLQVAYGSDVVICLDDCTHVDAPPDEQRSSVERTIAWAGRGRAEYDRLMAQKGLPSEMRPHLFAVIQGGGDHDLRLRCAESLLQIGFDGFGYGGWPLDKDGNLLEDILAYVRQLVPRPFPLHALGVGHPQNVLTCHRLGYDIYDSAMPTRDARHGRLYAFTVSPQEIKHTPGPGWFGYVYVQDKRHIKANHPISPYCDCHCCRRYSLGYLHHLFKINDTLYQRLATLHNLRFMTLLMDQLREQS